MVVHVVVGFVIRRVALIALKIAMVRHGERCAILREDGPPRNYSETLDIQSKMCLTALGDAWVMVQCVDMV